MKFLKKIFSHRNFLPLLIIIAFSVLAGRGLIGPGYFNMHDDLQMMRQLEMEKCFLDLQIPCRWVPDMGYGFGFPLFNFYPPLPYLVGEIFRLFGISFVDTVKITFILSFIGSGITMYFLAKEFFGRFGGVVSGIFYIWAPYHSVDVYVRGAMNEAWALIWFPLILLCLYKIASEKKKLLGWLVGLSLSLFGLLTSHNLMVLIFAPLAGIWTLIWIVKHKSWNRIIPLGISGIFSVFLSAFFTIPVLAEQKLVQTDTLIKGYYEYSAHFATINQLLFSRFWGYGPSIWMENDGMSFQVGHVHWILSLVVLAIVAFRFLRTRKIDSLVLAVLFFVLASWFAAFMTHSKSILFWQNIGPLSFVQFPWRFLTLVILGFSFAAGALVKLIPGRLSLTMSVLATALVIILNWNYFVPQNGKLGALTDEEKFTGAAWDLQQTAGIYDYLPKYAVTAPKEPQSKEGLAQVMSGKGKVSNPTQNTNSASFDIEVFDAISEVRVGIFKFDGWRVYVDGREIEPYVPDTEQWGRMWIKVPNGTHTVTLKFKDTPVRLVSNVVSLCAWLALLAFPIWQKRLSTLV